MKKLAFIYDCIYPYQLGGAEKRIYSLSHYLKKDFEVHIIGMRKEGQKKNFIENGIHYHTLNKYSDLYNKEGKRKIFLSIQFAFSLFFFLLKNDYEIIDTTANPYFHIFSIKLISLFKRKMKVFVTWHEYWDLNYWTSYSSYFVGIIGYILEIFALYSFSDIISVSNFTKKRIEKKIKRKVYLVENGIDKIKIKKENKIYDLIYTGRIIDFKNIDKILELTKINKKLKIVIVGDGPDLKKYKNKYKNKNILFTGFLKNETDIHTYIAQSKIFMMLSSREGFSIATLEAMSIGLPVICFNGKDNAAIDFIKNYENGILTDLKLKNINSAINIILKDYNKYSVNAKKDLDKNYLYKNIYPRYKKTINL